MLGTPHFGDGIFDCKITVRISRLDSYILKQLVFLFLFTVSLLSAVGVSVGTLSDLAYQISNYDLPLTVAIKIFILKIPEYIAYGLPIGTLLTTLIVYGRLNRDREIIALKSVGISIKKIILPAIYLSIVISLITFIINEFVVPQANHRVTLLQHPFLSESQFALQRKDIFYPEYESSSSGEKKLKRLYYAEKFDGKNLNNIVVMSWQNDNIQQIITAKYARWNTKLKSWNVRQGTIETLDEDILKSGKRNFDSYQVSLPITLFKIVDREGDPYIMSLTQAQTYLQLISNSNNLAKIRLFQVRIQQKVAFPSICIIFALIGSSLGTTFSNLNRGKSFGLCVGIVFLYYLLGFTIGSLGIAGLISPFIAAWLPNAIGLGFGCWLLRGC